MKWPNESEVHRKLEQWAQKLRTSHPEVARIGYYGSYATGEWGVGSDLDLIIVAANVESRPELRGLDYPTEKLPVPTELRVFSPEEFDELRDRGDRFAEVLSEEVVWVS